MTAETVTDIFVIKAEPRRRAYTHTTKLSFLSPYTLIQSPLVSLLFLFLSHRKWSYGNTKASLQTFEVKITAEEEKFSLEFKLHTIPKIVTRCLLKWNGHLGTCRAHSLSSFFSCSAEIVTLLHKKA